MNEIQKLIKALDVYEEISCFDDAMMTDRYKLKEVFIFRNDIVNIKNFIRKAQNQLENLEIEVREEE